MRVRQPKEHPPTFTVMMPLGKPQGTNHGLQVFRHGKHATIGLSTKVRGWKGTAYNLLAASLPALEDHAKLFPRNPQPVGLGIVFLTQGAQSYSSDMDGSIKFAQDALAHAWRFNDARIRGLVVMQIVLPDGQESLPGATFYWLGPLSDLPSGQALVDMARAWFTHNQFL